MVFDLEGPERDTLFVRGGWAGELRPDERAELLDFLNDRQRATLYLMLTAGFDSEGILRVGCAFAALCFGGLTERQLDEQLTLAITSIGAAFDALDARYPGR